MVFPSDVPNTETEKPGNYVRLYPCAVATLVKTLLTVTVKHAAYRVWTADQFLYMGKIQKMLKMPTHTFNNKATNRTAGVAAVPETEVDSVFSLETYSQRRDYS